VDFREKGNGMNLRTIPRYGVRSVPGEEKEIVAAFRRGEAVTGPAVSEFEERFAAYHYMDHAIAASYGRMAFNYILHALNLPAGSEIIFPALTFWAVPEIARRAGFRPVFVDVDPFTFNLDRTAIAKAITEHTRVIVPTHLYGQPCDLKEILRIAEKHNLIVVEDCAQAAGARYRGRLVGTFGTASFFSFQMLKGINTYGGGMALTNNHELAARVRDLAASEPLPSTTEVAERFLKGYAARIVISPKVFTFWGWPIQTLASMFSDVDLSKFLWENVRPLDSFPRAYTQRYSNAQAVIGIRGLGKLDEYNARSREHALRYGGSLSDYRSIQTPLILPTAEHVYYQYCIYTSDPRRTSRRAICRGVDLETMHVDVCSGLPLFKAFAAACPGAEATKGALQLPVYSRLRPSDVDRVSHVMRKVTCGLAPFGERKPALSTSSVAAGSKGLR
jgi:dTDP-4-amino-4,6-dideoxygalactose transaminase